MGRAIIDIDAKLKNAEEFFLKKEYRKAINTYSDILAIDTTNEFAKIGVLLADLASEHEQEAHALYDYYLILKSEENIDADMILKSAIENFDGNIDKISQIFTTLNSSKVDAIDGISYEDFKVMISDRGSFKRAFEDLMYSTKIVISGHNDFIEFMNELVDNGFSEVALTYLENAGDLFPYDENIRFLLNKINRIEHIED